MKIAIVFFLTVLGSASVIWITQNGSGKGESMRNQTISEHQDSLVSENIIDSFSYIVGDVKDSIPKSYTFKEALDLALKKDSFNYKKLEQEGYFNLNSSVGNNSGLGHFILDYFNKSIRLNNGEVVSSVNGIDEVVSTVKVFDKGGQKYASHKIYGKEYHLLNEFTIKAVGFESSESVNLCSGGKIVVDDISGFSNGNSVFIYEPGNDIRHLVLDDKYEGIAVRCINNRVYIIAKSKGNNTSLFVVDGGEVILLTEIVGFESSPDISVLKKKGLLLLSDMNSKEAFLIDPTPKKVTKLSATGNCSIYDRKDGVAVVGANGRRSSISFINNEGEEVYNGLFEGVLLGFAEDLPVSSSILILFDKNSKIISRYEFNGGKHTKTEYPFSKYRNFDELVFIWNEKLIDLRSSFGIK